MDLILSVLGMVFYFIILVTWFVIKGLPDE